jgi:glycosyl transferase, family 25
LFSAFDRAFVINLESRSDRRRWMRRELEKVGLKADFFPAIRPDSAGIFTSIGMHGSFLSHAAVVRAAAQSDESVLILEDDCDFLPEARTYRVPEVDIFYGSHGEDADEIIGAHCMGFSAKTVKLLDAYLQDYARPDFEPDPQAANEPHYNPSIRPPIDGAYVWFRRKHPELTTHFAKLTFQRPSRSDCTPARKVDLIPLVRDALEIGRRVKAAFA